MEYLALPCKRLEAEPWIMPLKEFEPFSRNEPFRLVENTNLQDRFFRSFKYLHGLTYQNRFITPTVKMRLIPISFTKIHTKSRLGILNVFWNIKWVTLLVQKLEILWQEVTKPSDLILTLSLSAANSQLQEQNFIFKKSLRRCQKTSAYHTETWARNNFKLLA